MTPLYDLIISTRRAAKFTGHSQNNDGKIIWVKMAGQSKQTFKGIHRLSDANIAQRLQKYDLIDQVATTTEVLHRFRLKEKTQ